MCKRITTAIIAALCILCVVVAILTIHNDDDGYVYEPRIIAHRGGIQPDNMFENIVQKLSLDFIDGIEVDVQMSKDNVIVLYHDDDLSTQTDGTGKVCEHTYDHLEKLNMEHQNPDLSSYNFKITKLEDVIKFMVENGMDKDKILHLDIKQKNAINPIIDMLVAHKMVGSNVIFDASNNGINNELNRHVKHNMYFFQNDLASSISNSVKAYLNFMFKVNYDDRNLVLYYTNKYLKPFMSGSLANYFHKKHIKIGVYGSHIKDMEVVEHYISKRIDYVLMDLVYNL